MREASSHNSGHISGHVTVNERVPSQSFNRFVDDKMADWMSEHQMSPDTSEYEVAFFDEDPLGEVSCLIVIQAGENMWRAWETADTPREAFKRSLDSLHVEQDEETALETTPAQSH